VNHGRRKKFDAGVAVLLVIPSEKFLAEGVSCSKVLTFSPRP
jgi:hypothetical protein